MKKGKLVRELKRVATLVLSAAMLVTQMPVTSLAAEDSVEMTEAESADLEKELFGADIETDKKHENGEEKVLENAESVPAGNENPAQKEMEAAENKESGEEETQTETETEGSEGNTQMQEEPETNGSTAEETQIETEGSSEEESQIQDETASEEVDADVENGAADAGGFEIVSGVLKKYSGTATAVEIPSTVTEIGENAFKGNTKIRSIVIPGSVNKIGNNAFKDCTLLGIVTLNDGLETIGWHAFENVAFGEKNDATNKFEPKTLTIPGSVKTIGAYAFQNSGYLKEVTFENGGNETLTLEQYYSDGNAFYGCKNLERVTLPNRLKAIAGSTFNKCIKLRAVSFGSSLETVGNNAFAGCTDLREIALPAGVKTIEESAFKGCTSLGVVTLNDGLETIGKHAFENVAFGEKNDATNKFEPKTLTIPGTVKKIGEYAFQNSGYLKEVTFQNGENKLLTFEQYYSDGNAFYGCAKLERVTLPDRLEVIAEKTFKNCTSLREVIFCSDPDKNVLKTVNNNAFEGCTNLREITLPAGVKTIGNGAFKGCTSLGIVTLNDGLETIGWNAFENAAFGEKDDATNKYTPKTLTIPGSVQKIGAYAFQNSGYLKEVTFNNGENRLLTFEQYYSDGNAFYGCTQLERVTLPDRLEVIAEQTFKKCTSLREVIFCSDPDKNVLKTVNNSAFEGCTNLREITLPAGVKTIGNSAFKGCTSLGIVTLNDGLETIGWNAFENAAFGEKDDATEKYTPKTLTIPGSVQKIGAYAFQNSGYLKEVTFENGVNKLLMFEQYYSDGNAFYGCANLERVTLPDRLEVIAEQTFKNCTSLREVIFFSDPAENVLKTVNNSAFEGCTNLREITLPAGVKTIGSGAFKGCTSLGIVMLNDGLEIIGKSAFENAAFGEKDDATNKYTPKTLTIPGSVQKIGAYAFQNSGYLKEVTFENGVNKLLTFEQYYSEGNAFYGCANLERVTLPDRLEVIAEQTFKNCTNLREVIFFSDPAENVLKTVNNSAFEGCTNLREITLPAGVKTIGSGAFKDCTSLGIVMLNDGLEIIGMSAFENAAFGKKDDATNKFTPKTLTIPGSVQKIGAYAFKNSEYLKEVTFENDENKLLTFEQYYSNGEAFYGCKNLVKAILPDRLEKIAERTFKGCPNLAILYIPEYVTVIANEAAVECPKLTIYGKSGSEAQTYANEKGIPFNTGIPTGSAEVPVKSITLTPSVIEKVGATGIIGSTEELNPIILPDEASDQKVTYKSYDNKVATVDAQGKVTITGYGETIITATAGEKTAQCDVIILKEVIDTKPEIKMDEVTFPVKAEAKYEPVYTGYQIRPVMKVVHKYKEGGKDKTLNLKLNTDYTVEYDKNIAAGVETAVVIVKGIGEYKGEVIKNFTIKPKDIKGVTLSPVGDVIYSDDVKSKVKVTVTDGVFELERGVDYEIELTKEGLASVDTVSELTVKGIKGSNYTGESKKKVKFNILKSEEYVTSIADAQITLKYPAKTYIYNGKAQKPVVVVKDSNNQTIPTSNYRVLYANNVNAGEGQIYVVGVTKKGQGYYGESKTPCTFPISAKPFSKVSAKSLMVIPKVGTMSDIKAAIAKAIMVSDGKYILKSNEYEIDDSVLDDIAYSNDLRVGAKYTIILKPKGGNYYDDSVQPDSANSGENIIVDKLQKKVDIKFGQLSFGSKTARIEVEEMQEVTDARTNKTKLVVTKLSYNGLRVPPTGYSTSSVKLDSKTNTYTVSIKATKDSAYKGSGTKKNVSLGVVKK